MDFPIHTYSRTRRSICFQLCFFGFFVFTAPNSPEVFFAAFCCDLRINLSEVDYTFVADIFSNLNHWNMEANKVNDSHRPPTDGGTPQGIYGENTVAY